MYKSVVNRLCSQFGVETKGEVITRLIESGKTNNEIANLLGIKSSLVTYYRRRHADIPFLSSNRERSLYAHSLIYDEYIGKWKAGEVSGGKKIGYGCVSNYVRRYIHEKYKDQCALCGWKEVNKFTNTVPLEIEHIDGNCENHREENLILLCPNCHSLTAGHSTSKSNSRRYYRELYNASKMGSRSDG